ncbi:defensin-like protein 19 [Syzygium oleosum]|uniref:defensin-like protein 19 n=1 Tax=Syzygium oleosum TaxID=219896 RepID=UPI0024B959AD|nr:defensin-like protein 19 [Syzygium oleosum]
MLRSSRLNYSLFLLSILFFLYREAKLSERHSQTWSGFSGDSGSCDSQCRKWEGASQEACHAEFPGFACFFYYFQLVTRSVTITVLSF